MLPLSSGGKQRLYDQQKRELWSDAGDAVNFRLNYKVESGDVNSSKPVAYGTVLGAENVATQALSGVDVTSHRRSDDATCITRVDAKSECLVILLMNKDYDHNLAQNQLRPSELLWQSFA